MSGPYASGRTRVQGGGSAVLEGRVLYVTARGEALIREAMGRCVATSRLERSAVACAAAGAISLEITCLVADGLPLTAIVVDHDLVHNPEYAESQKRGPRRGPYESTPKQRNLAAKGRRARAAAAARAETATSQVALPSSGSKA